MLAVYSAPSGVFVSGKASDATKWEDAVALMQYAQGQPFDEFRGRFKDSL